MQKNNGANKGSWRLKNFVRRKQVDSVLVIKDGHHQLAKKLSVIDLIAIGVGATIGAGVYVLVGTVAREETGPALTISFLIAGIAAALSAFCYAELAGRCPSAGSAYHYTYICMGEGAAWLIGWALILEYTIGGSAIARGLTPNMALFFGGEDKLPSYLARHNIFGLDIVVDPVAAVLVLIVTVLLCLGIKESSLAQAIITAINVCGMLFIITTGAFIGFKTDWVGYQLPSGYFPFGIDGMLAGSAVVFFSYTGFDVVASTAEEVKNPQRDLPLGIGIALALCCILYMLVSVVIVGIVPYFSLDPDTPISSAFSSYDMQWAVYVITIGAVMALCASLLGSLLPQPRIFMAMARDGLLPSFLAEISEMTQVPVKGTIMIGILAAALAFFMDVSQLAGMVSIGALLAFTAVAVSILIIRYVPPNEVPFPSSFSLQYGGDFLEVSGKNLTKPANYCGEGTSIQHPLLHKLTVQGGENEPKRRKIAAWSITLLCMGVVILSSSASFVRLPSLLRFTSCIVGGALSLCSLICLACISQDNTRHSFGYTGGFICPLVPFLPVACIFVNTYLLVNLGSGTWIRAAVWLLLGALVYLFYGQTHSSLKNTTYISSMHANEIYQASLNRQS